MKGNKKGKHEEEGIIKLITIKIIKIFPGNNFLTVFFQEEESNFTGIFDRSNLIFLTR